MSQIVGLTGSASIASRTRLVVQAVVDVVSERSGVPSQMIDVADLAPDLGIRSRVDASPRVEHALKIIETAGLLVVGSPVYKGSYTGLLKHTIDLLDYPVLLGTPVALIATGGSERHALVVEHQLRPLFGFFSARTLPTGVFLADRDMVEGEIVNPSVRARLDQLIAEAVDALAHRQRG